MAIKSFNCKHTAKIFGGERSKRLPPEIQQKAFTKLRSINAAGEVNDLRIPPSNRLEKLQGDRKGQWSIRINSQWRICFEFGGGNAANVEITDYHA